MIMLYILTLLILLKLILSEISPLSSKDLLLNNLKRIYVSSLLGISGITVYQSIKDDKRYNDIHQELFDKYITNDKKALNILEIGFGNNDGANFDYYPNDNRINLVGIDPTIDMNDINKISRIKNKYSTKNINLELVQGSAEKMNFQSESFDLIVSTLVFCTIPNPILALRECSRVLKKSCHLIAIDHIQSDNDNFLAYQQKLLSPLQEIVADGCHLNRRTDLLFQQYTSSNNNNQNDILFDKILSQDYYTLNTQWPISRQVSVVLEK